MRITASAFDTVQWNNLQIAIILSQMIISMIITLSLQKNYNGNTVNVGRGSTKPQRPWVQEEDDMKTGTGSTHLPDSVCHRPSTDLSQVSWTLYSRVVGIVLEFRERFQREAAAAAAAGEESEASGERQRLLDVISC